MAGISWPKMVFYIEAFEWDNPGAGGFLWDSIEFLLISNTMQMRRSPILLDDCFCQRLYSGTASFKYPC
jgi:hypothetical protein